MEENNISASKQSSLEKSIQESNNQQNKKVASQKKTSKSKQPDKNLDTNEKVIKKASAAKTIPAKADITEPKPGRVKKAPTAKSKVEKQSENEQKPRAKKQNSVNKQLLPEENNFPLIQEPVKINPAPEEQLTTPENDVTIVPSENFGQQENVLQENKVQPSDEIYNENTSATEIDLPLKPEEKTEILFNESSIESQLPVQKEEPAQETSLIDHSSFNTKSSLRKITFQIRFYTNVGQSLFVTGNHSLLGNNTAKSAFPLGYLNDEYWSGSLEIPEGEQIAQNISYQYILKNNDGTTAFDWGDKIIQPSQYKTKEILLIDSWNSSSFIENTFYTEPFQQVLLKDNYTKTESQQPSAITHVFRAKTPLLTKGQTLCILGSDIALGGWDTANAILLSKKEDENWYTVSLDLSNSTFPFAYKYGVFDTNSKKFVRFEDGNNRSLNDEISKEKLTIVSDGFAVLPPAGFKGAGVAIPVFSLRSEKSFGAGEFSDLKLLVDWAKESGLKLIQILPVNDTTATHTFTDSYPYAAISAFALHPLYLHLPALTDDANDILLLSFEEKGKEFNSQATVDYLGVMAAKWSFIKQIFPSQKQKTFESEDFKAFLEENAHWLIPYAAFSYLREKYNTADFNEWPTNKTFDPEKIKSIAASPLHDQDEVSIYYYVQYHLHLQLRDATNYAHQNGIILKGDIPIGIYRYSCDAWQEPALFNMDVQAGAPPDNFAVKGQNWGFPTYNWHQMRENGFKWWKNRFKQMSYYFDAFRIDHILGFFRIWSIPMNAVEGILGHFVPAVPVYPNELFERRISFDIKRFTQPYINEAILTEVFGSEKEGIVTQFLQPSSHSNYILKPEFDTQRKVESYFSTLEKNELNEKIKIGLFDLISNIILFEAEGAEGSAFHFRIAMDNTSSFRFLDGNTQYNLKELYLNYFYRRQDSFWQKEAMLKLPELKRSTNMLICGEDLGMVPDCVPGVMKELAILSLEIQRMPKNPKREFFHPNDALYLSVVTPSTHDMSTIRGWWEEDRSATQRFFINELGQWGTAPYFCEPWINKIIVVQHLYSAAMWSIFQLQDLLGMDAVLRRQNPQDERINIPANPQHYWRYRMHLTLESLIKENGFNNELKAYIQQSGRGQ